MVGSGGESAVTVVAFVACGAKQSITVRAEHRKLSSAPALL